MDILEFAAARSARLKTADEEIGPMVGKVARDGGGWADVVEGAAVLWLEIFQREAPKAYPDKVLQDFQDDLKQHLAETTKPIDVDRVTKWIGTYTVNNATYHANRAVGGKTMRWVTMHDDAVRHTHREADGQVVSVSGTFNIGGYKLHYPGEPVGPAEIWINCRCLLASGKVKAMTASGLNTTEEFLAEYEPDEELPTAYDMEADGLVDDEVDVPFHAVLAPEGVATGDQRMFKIGALSNRELPVPLSYQYQSTDGHGGSVVIGRIDEIWKDERNFVLGRGVFNMNEPMAQRVVEDIANGFTRGLSVDVDDIEVDVQELADDSALDTGKMPLQVFSKARIAGATVVSIPAFQEAYIALGGDFPDAEALAACGCSSTPEMADSEHAIIVDLTGLTPEEFAHYEGMDDADAMQWLEDFHPEAILVDDDFRDVSTKERKRLADSGEAMPDGSFV